VWRRGAEESTTCRGCCVVDMDAERRAGLMPILSHFGVSLDQMEADGVLLDLNPNWPGTTVDPKQMRANPAEMYALADRLEEAVREIQRVPGDLTGGTQPTTFGPDRWASAAAMTRTHRAVSDSVITYTKMATEMFLEAASAIRYAADVISGADERNQANARGVDASSGGGREINYDFWRS
jgi:hypothetical protein